MTKNLTLAIDEGLLDRARVIAAIKRTSVNELVRAYLERLVEQEKGKDEAREALLKLAEESTADMGDWKWNRDELYDRRTAFDR
jgi:Family of unknown function (DUF6364)